MPRVAEHGLGVRADFPILRRTFDGRPLVYLAEYVTKESDAFGEQPGDVVFNRRAAEISGNGNPQFGEIGTPQLGRNTPIVAGVFILVAELGAQQKMSIRHRAGHWTGDSE